MESPKGKFNRAALLFPVKELPELCIFTNSLLDDEEMVYLFFRTYFSSHLVQIY